MLTAITLAHFQFIPVNIYIFSLKFCFMYILRNVNCIIKSPILIDIKLRLYLMNINQKHHLTNAKYLKQYELFI